VPKPRDAVDPENDKKEWSLLSRISTQQGHLLLAGRIVISRDERYQSTNFDL